MKATTSLLEYEVSIAPPPPSICQGGRERERDREGKRERVTKKEREKLLTNLLLFTVLTAAAAADLL